MRIEANLIEKKEQKKNCQLPREENNNSSIQAKKIRKRNKKSMPAVIQKLFQTCKEVFATCEAGKIPPVEDVERLKVVLVGVLVALPSQLLEQGQNRFSSVSTCYTGDCCQIQDFARHFHNSMKPVHVGLTPDMPYFRTIETEGAPPITYLHIYECPQFSIGIFCLPPSGVIPLHNHPGMTVFSKLLFGSMHIKSYDWVDVPHSASENLDRSNMKPPGVRLSKVKVDTLFTAPCDTSILYPNNGGNMHCFTALTSCAVLDVLGPPYSDPDGRHCTYYRDLPYTSFPVGEEIVAEEEREGYAWLQEMEKPEDFNVVGALYRGPKISR